MPRFVYYKAQNVQGYSMCILFTDGKGAGGKDLMPHVFQSVSISDEDALKGINYLVKKHPVCLPKED